MRSRGMKDWASDEWIDVLLAAGCAALMIGIAAAIVLAVVLSS